MLILPTLDAFTVRAMVPGVFETPVALTLRPDWTVALAVEALEMQLLATRGLHEYGARSR